jgi:hypothetical protein
MDEANRRAAGALSARRRRVAASEGRHGPDQTAGRPCYDRPRGKPPMYVAESNSAPVRIRHLTEAQHQEAAQHKADALGCARVAGLSRA